MEITDTKLLLQVTEYIKEKAHYGPKKVAFRPFLYLESEGIAMDMLMEGLTFFDLQMGITNLAIYSQGMCICGAEGEENARVCPAFESCTVMIKILSPNLCVIWTPGNPFIR